MIVGSGKKGTGWNNDDCTSNGAAVCNGNNFECPSGSSSILTGKYDPAPGSGYDANDDPKPVDRYYVCTTD